MHRHGAVLGYLTCEEQQAPVSAERLAAVSGAVACRLVSCLCQV